MYCILLCCVQKSNLDYSFRCSACAQPVEPTIRRTVCKSLSSADVDSHLSPPVERDRIDPNGPVGLAEEGVGQVLNAKLHIPSHGGAKTNEDENEDARTKKPTQEAGS